MEEDFCRVLLVGTAVKSAYITQHGNGKAVKSVTNYLSVFFAQRILFLHFVLFCFSAFLHCFVLASNTSFLKSLCSDLFRSAFFINNVGERQIDGVLGNVIKTHEHTHTHQTSDSDLHLLQRLGD